MVAKYGNGVGADVFDFGGEAIIVEDTGNAPFFNGEFDTVILEHPFI